MIQRPDWIESLREQYPPGTRIRLEQMNDPFSPVLPGTMGTVDRVDDIGTYGKLADMKSYARNACNSP